MVGCELCIQSVKWISLGGIRILDFINPGSPPNFILSGGASRLLQRG